MKYYYAATNCPLHTDDYDAGYANTWGAIAFDSRSLRDAVLSDTKALHAHACTRREALKLASRYGGMLLVRLYSPDNNFADWVDIASC